MSENQQPNHSPAAPSSQRPSNPTPIKVLSHMIARHPVKYFLGFSTALVLILPFLMPYGPHWDAVVQGLIAQLSALNPHSFSRNFVTWLKCGSSYIHYAHSSLPLNEVQQLSQDKVYLHGWGLCSGSESWRMHDYLDSVTRIPGAAWYTVRMSLKEGGLMGFIMLLAGALLLLRVIGSGLLGLLLWPGLIFFFLSVGALIAEYLMLAMLTIFHGLLTLLIFAGAMLWALLLALETPLHFLHLVDFIEEGHGEYKDEKTMLMQKTNGIMDKDGPDRADGE